MAAATTLGKMRLSLGETVRRVARPVARRLGIGAAMVLVVLTGFYLFAALTPDPQLASMLYGMQMHSSGSVDVSGTVARYNQAHGYDRPLYVRYLAWLGQILTLHWGYSASQGAPVMDLVRAASARTLAYLLPAVACSTVVGVSAGVYAALRKGSLAERAETAAAYVAFGLPNFYLAIVLTTALPALGGAAVVAALPESALPALVVAVTLLAGQLHYARTETGRFADAEFAKLKRAQGAPRRVVARHVLRVAAAPLSSALLSEYLGVLVVDVFVIEQVFGIRGLGSLGLEAVERQDTPLMLSILLFVVLVGVAISVLQDVTDAILDPRVE